MKVKRKGALGALLAMVAALVVGRHRGRIRVCCRQAGRDRLGLRQQGQHGALRRSGAGRGAGPRQAGQRARWRAAEDHHLRHAEQQSGQGQVVRAEPARPGREHHLHDLRRRLRDAGRAGGHQPRRARGRARASAPIRWARSASAPRAPSPSASATSPRTRARPWRSGRGARAGRRPAPRTNTLLVYFKNVVQAFEARFKQLGGKIVGHETLRDRRQQRAGGRQPPERRQGRRLRDRRPSFGELPGFVTGMRALGNNTPILNSWAGDGTYWVAEGRRRTTTP